MNLYINLVDVICRNKKIAKHEACERTLQLIFPRIFREYNTLKREKKILNEQGKFQSVIMI